jgi:hypothetical protein
MALIVDKHEKYVVVRLNEETFTNDNAPLLKSEFILLNSQGYRNMIMDLSMVKKCEDSQDESLNFVAKLREAEDLIFMEEVEKDLLGGSTEEADEDEEN